MITVDIDDREVRAVLGRIAARCRDASPLMREISADMLFAVQENFAKEGRPERWEKSRRVKKKGGQTLQDSRRLHNSITAHSTATSAQVGTNVKYAAIHQFGGTVKHKERSQVLHFTQARKGQRTGGRDGDRFARANRKAGYAMKVKIGAHETTIPARPFLHLEPTDLRRIMEAARRFLDGRP
jgi:phage virion morphogenesis protein